MEDFKMEEHDRLSELPESLIHHILSFLPMRDVVSTTLLSKRWENLWTTLPSLNFSPIISLFDDLDSHRVRNFVNRALMFWKGTKLLKFIIDINRPFDKSLAGDMNLWVRFAVQNKVEELNIHLMYEEGEMEMEWEEAEDSKRDVYRAPRCLNLCSSIRKLSLVGCNPLFRGSIAWNQLKSLMMSGFYFSEHLINRIMLGTPQLEVFELRLMESRVNLTISSTSLKKLKINKYLFFDNERPSLETVLGICCPNLEMLDISEVLYGECLFTNVSTLTDATLNGSTYYTVPEIDVLGETMRCMFSTFQHVERVTLSSSSYEVLRASLKKNLFPPLPNVVFLEVGVCSIKPDEMVHLLEIFPNLKMLVFRDQTPYRTCDINVEFATNLSNSFLLQLKIVEITSNYSKSSIFWFIEFLLNHGSMLEKLVIRTKCTVPHSQDRLLEVAETLLSMPRSSPTANVIFNKN